MDNSGSSTQEVKDAFRFLGREIKAARVLRGWTQKQLALAASAPFDEKYAVSYQQVGKIERGEYGQWHEVQQLAMALGLPLSELHANAEKHARAEAARKRAAG